MTPIRRLLAITIALGTLSGCVVGPGYHEPRPPSGASSSFITARPDLAMADEPPGDWWRLYADANLDALVHEALSANYDLAAANANLRAAAAVLSATKVGRYPTTTAGGSATYGRSQLANLLAADVGADAHADWVDAATFGVAYQVDLFGQIKRGIEAARADAEAARAARDAVRVTVAAQATAAFADACALGQSIAVARRSLDLAHEIEQTTRKRHAAGLDTNFDLARTQALVAQTAAAIPPLEGQRRAALIVLTTLLGRTPADQPRSAQACSAPLHLTSLIPVGDGAALLRRRPDVRLAERNLAGATARIGVATSALYPTVSLGGSIALTAKNPGDFTDYRALSYGLGPLVTWTIPNTATARARIRQARAGADAALARWDGAVLQALSETEQALSTYGAELDRHAQLTVARDRGAEAFRLAGLQRRDGALPYLDVLNAEQTLINADAALAASDRALAADQVTVFKALGGGWQTMMPKSSNQSATRSRLQQ